MKEALKPCLLLCPRAQQGDIYEAGARSSQTHVLAGTSGFWNREGTYLWRLSHEGHVTMTQVSHSGPVLHFGKKGNSGTCYKHGHIMTTPHTVTPGSHRRTNTTSVLPGSQSLETENRMLVMGVGVRCYYMTSLCNTENVWVHSKGDTLRESTVHLGPSHGGDQLGKLSKHEVHSCSSMISQSLKTDVSLERQNKSKIGLHPRSQG